MTVGFFLGGCNNSQTVTQSPSPVATATASATPSVAPSPTASSSQSAAEIPVISAQGIGSARLGMTLGELKQALGTEAEFETQSPFLVDFDAIAVRKKGEIQYYILHLVGQPLADKDVIQGLMTENPSFRTAEGVGAGTSLQDAEKIYGKATLSYNTQNESREYARFERQPANNISFATGNGNAQAAGVYASSTKEYNETQEFRPDALIQSVLVVCLTDACAAASPTP